MNFETAAESSDTVRVNLQNWTRKELLYALTNDAFIEAETEARNGLQAAETCERLLAEHSHEDLVEMVVELHEAA